LLVESYTNTMAIGYICSCCGEKGSREDGTDTKSMMFCQPCGEAPKASPPDMSVHTIELDTPVVVLEASTAFSMLTPNEQAYAYALGKADWEGAKICLLQCSPESVPIFCLLQLVFSAQTMEELKAAALENEMSSDEVSQAIIYAAAFYGNMGNYKSFGDTKFVPALPAQRFRLLLHSSKARKDSVEALWDECCLRMYSLPPRHRQMGIGAENGISTYFSANCTENDAKLANAFLDSIGLSAYNTRLFKSDDGNYTVRLASAVRSPTEGVDNQKNVHVYKGKTFTIAVGDYAPLMKRVVNAIQEAIPHVANPTQESMLQNYVTSFTTGSIPDHKNASRDWIKDTGPAVESYIGFIESYRDPSGVRGEWEGFVSCVNKEVSRKFQVLVDKAETFLEKMPWTKEFEKDTFLRPDFTSLEVLSFGSSGVPAGINIPNYDDIRQSEGFKNVSLGNVLQASYGSAVGKKVTFISDHDQEMFKALKAEAFEVQVGIHELLGHGSGKIYHQGTPDADALAASGFIHPITGEPITGPFFDPGSSWDSTFGKIASTYEECRAECTGLYLCLEPEILQVFSVLDAQTDLPEISDVAYINWLLMARAGLTGLEFYTPETKGWRQAHMQARYVILRVLLEAGELLTLKQVVGEDGNRDVHVVLNRKLISTLGKKIIGEFLLKLQVYKSLGDIVSGSTMYNQYAEVPEEMSKLREIVMARKEPRKLLIQPHMYKGDDNGVKLQTFSGTPEGMIESFKSRFPAEDLELMALYNADKVAMND